MEKRKVIFGNYDTAAELWTMEACQLSAPQHVTNMVDVPGGVPVDMATALTDGVPYYTTRTLTVQLTSSEGTRQDRLARISDLFNLLSGQRVRITLPDDPDHYLMGTVGVAQDYCDMAHAGVTVTAVCDPWRYANVPTVAPVNLCGKNLVDASVYHDLQNTTYPAKYGGGVLYTPYSDFNGLAVQLRPVPVDPTKTYSFSYTATGGDRIVISFFDADGTNISATASNFGLYLPAYSGRYGAVGTGVTFTMTPDVAYIRLTLCAMNTVADGEYNAYANLQLEEGTAVTAYEAYAPAEAVQVTLENARSPVVPVIHSFGGVTLAWGDNNVALGEGAHTVPALRLLPYSTVAVTVEGTGGAVFTYREAVL